MTWPMVALGEVVEITMGQAPPGGSYNTTGDGVPLIAGPGDFKNGMASPTKFTTSPSQLCAVGDIILGIRASIGAKVLADQVFCLGRGVAGLRTKSDQLDARYLWHALSRYEEDLKRRGKGATFLQVNRKDIGTLTLLLPPLDEQRRIAAVLDQASAVRDLRLETITKFDHIKRAIVNQLLKENWPSVALGSIASTTSGGTPDRSNSEYYGGEIPWVKSGELHSGVVTKTEETITVAGLEGSSAKLFPAGTVLIAMYGATAGVVGQLGIAATTNQAICAITPNDELNATYLMEALRHQASKLNSLRSGGAQPNLSQKILRSFEIALPPIEEQLAFAKQIEHVNIKQNQAECSSSAIEELIDSLQSRAFRGEL